MNLTEALEIISNFDFDHYKVLKAGLPTGKHSEVGYDERLVIEIGAAFKSWVARQDQIQDPYCVWFFDGTAWSKATEDLYEEDAYKAWYNLTDSAKTNKDSSFQTYYYFGSSREELKGRHKTKADDDDFSIGYLLNKSFGE